MSEARLPNIQENGKNEHVHFNSKPSRPRFEDDQLLNEIEAIIDDTIDLDAQSHGSKKRTHVP